MNDELDTLLQTAIVKGEEESCEALLEAGEASVTRFHEWLSGDRRISLPTGRDREFIDTTTTVSCRLAARFPDRYVALFNSPRWATYSLVVAGLGYTRKPEVIPLLIEALFSDAPGVTRLSAASALGFFPGDESVGALLKALVDDDYLVRYHAIMSLGSVGDRVALDRIRSLAETSANRGIVLAAAKAVRSIASRLGVSSNQEP